METAWKAKTNSNKMANVVGPPVSLYSVCKLWMLSEVVRAYVCMYKYKYTANVF